MRFIALVLSLILSPATWPAFVCKPGSGGTSETPIQTVRNFFWMAVGFPGATEYSCFHEGDSGRQAIVSQNGIIGDINTVRAIANTALSQDLGPSSSCSNIPSSGSYSYSSNETITYQSPSNSIPVTYPGGGGSYDKRIRYVNTSNNTTVFFEFTCSLDRMMAKVSKNINGSGKWQYIIAYFDNTTTTKYIDFYFYDDENLSDRINLAVIFRVYSDNTMDAWITRTGYRTSNNAWTGYRFTSKVNYSTQANTIHYSDLSGEGLLISNYTGNADIDSTSVTSTVATDGSGPGGGGGGEMRMGCATSFSTATDTISSTSTCPGLDLSSAPNTAFGHSMTMQGIQQNMLTDLNNTN